MGLNLRAFALTALVVLSVLGPPAHADGRLSPQGGTITSVGATAGGGLTGGATGGPAYLGLLTTCSPTQVLQWSGSAWICADVLGGAIIEPGIIRPAAITGTVDDWTPTGLATASTIIVGTSGATTLDGITGGVEGRILRLCNTGTFELALANDTGPTAANRFLLAGAATWRLGSTGNSCATFLYDGTAQRWKMISKTGTSFPSLSINTSGVASTITTYAGPNSVGSNIWIGGGGLFTVGDVVHPEYGSQNTSMGAGALAFDTVGFYGSAFGSHALYNNTTGHDNSAFGAFALQANTDGQYQTALGTYALLVHVHGDASVALGEGTLVADTTGTGNTAIGTAALSDLNITANDGSGNNTVIGNNTGRGLVTGINNTIVGANVTGLAAGLSGQIIIADGGGNKRIQVDSSARTTLAGTLQIMGTGSRWTSGTGVPVIACAVGDEFSRTDGGIGTTHYNCTATNTWTANGVGSGTVTSIATGSGITGGTITTTGTIGYDSSIIQSRVSGTCAGPNAITAIASGGTVTCSTGVATTTDINTAVNGAAGQVAVYSAAHALTGYAGFTSDSSGDVAIGGTLGVTGSTTLTTYSAVGTTVSAGTMLRIATGATDILGLTAINTTTGAVVATRSLNQSKDTGTYDLTSAGTTTYMYRATSSASRSTGAFSLTAYGFYADVTNAQNPYAFFGVNGLMHNAGAVDFGSTLGVTGATTLSSTTHAVGAITDDSTLTTTQLSVGTTSLAGGRVDVVLAAATTVEPGAWGSQWATFGSAAGSTGGALGVAYDNTTGAVMTAIDPGVTFKLFRFNASQFGWLTSDTTRMFLAAGGLLTVGVGADAPGATGTTAIVENNGTTCSEVRDATNDVEAEHCASSSGAFFGSFTNHSMFLQTNNTNALKIDTSQQVEALAAFKADGAATLSSTLHLVGAGTFDSALAVTGTLTEAAHIVSLTSGGIPTVASCGTSPSITGTDQFAIVTPGTSLTGNVCQYAFAHAYTNTPACTASSSNINDGYITIVPTHLGWTFTGSLRIGTNFTGNVSVICGGIDGI